MKKYHPIILPAIICILFQAVLVTQKSFATVITKDEALSVADAWYAMEVNSGHLKLSESERIQKLEAIVSHKLCYLTKDTILENIGTNQAALAFIITYSPNGFIMVSGDDRMLPVTAFSLTTNFKWGADNFMKTYIQRRIVQNWQHLGSESHPGWANLQCKMQIPFEQVNYFTDSPLDNTYILYDTPLWSQGTYYNETVIANNGSIPGIPTGCTATAMAEKLRYHQWPNIGSGTHGYSDMEGDVQFTHFVDPGSTNYNWAQMPMTNLASVNPDVELLMYQCGVMVDMDYEVGVSGAWPTVSSMNDNFRYRGTQEILYSPLWAFGDDIKNSIIGGLPTICSSTAHTVVVDGYRSTMYPYYHVNCGWGGTDNAWYDLETQFPGPGGDPSIDRSYSYCSPNNWVYANNSNFNFWSQLGTLPYPYGTLVQGYNNTDVNGQLWIYSGTYIESSSLNLYNKPMLITSYGGIAILK